jgi:hypothetical protein
MLRRSLVRGAAAVILAGAAACSSGTTASDPQGTTTSTVAASTPTGAAAAGGVGSIRWADRTYETRCGRAELRDGQWVDPPSEGFVIDSFSVAFADVTADGETDAIVSIGCAADGNHVDHQVTVYSAHADDIVQRGETIDEIFDSVSDTITTAVLIYDADDPTCCPSSEELHTWRWVDGAWRVERTELRSMGAE